MTIFTRVLVSFTAVIGIQAILTGSLISRSVEQFHEDDAQRELKNAAMEAFDGFNSWKSRLWRAAAALDQLQDSEQAAFMEQLLQAAEGAGADFIVLSAKESDENNGPRCIILQNHTFIPDASLLYNDKDHPYIQTILLPDGLYLAASFSNAEDDIFILKHIDDTMMALVSARPRVNSLLVAGTSSSAGKDPGGILELVQGMDLSGIYTILPDTEAAGTHWTAVIQNTGTVLKRQPAPSDNTELLPLHLVTLLSKEDFERRLQALQYAVITATALCAILTILISLGFSGNVAYPIRRLVEAMRTIRDGDYSVSVRHGIQAGSGERYYLPSGELAELVDGFDDMARELESDRIEREHYIREIEGITRFNTELLNSLEEAVVVISDFEDPVNGNYCIEQVNSAFGKLFPRLHIKAENGCPEGNKQDLGELDLNSVIRRAERKKPGTPQLRRLKNNRTLEIKTYPIKAGPFGKDDIKRKVLIIEDITQHIAFEEKIVQAEKLASMSILSAGVAHEINNPLTSILSNVQNLIEEEKSEDGVYSLKLIEQETRRIARIVRGLLDFSSSQGQNRDRTDAREAIQDVYRLMAYSFTSKNNINIDVHIEEGLEPLAIDPDSFKQILINILKNSYNALENSGSITIKLQKQDEHTALVTVSDTGKGIEKEEQSRIFDPFYTTSADGTGMGLSIVYGILQRAGGTISVESSPGKGTRMNIELAFFRETE